MEKIIRSPVISSVARRVGRAPNPAPGAAVVKGNPDADSVQSTPVEAVQSLKPASAAEPRPVAQQKQVEDRAALAHERREAERLAKEAELRSRLLEELQLQYEPEWTRIREQARGEGYEQGLSQGKEDGQKMVAAQLERLALLADSLTKMREDVVDASEDMLVEIAFAAVCRIIGESALTREGVVAMVSHVIAGFKDQSRLSVRLHPQDCELVQHHLAHSDGIGINPKITIRADASVTRGGCIVDGESGSLDARLDVQLHRLRECLMAVRRHKDISAEERAE